ARESQNPTRWGSPLLRKRRIPRAGVFHRSGIAESNALEMSTTRELRNLTRGDSPPPRNGRIPRGGELHRSGIAQCPDEGRALHRKARIPRRSQSQRLRKPTDNAH